MPIHKIKGAYTPSQGCTRLVPTSTALPRAFIIIYEFSLRYGMRKKIEKMIWSILRVTISFQDSRLRDPYENIYCETIRFSFRIRDFFRLK